ncbi:sterol desaturase family protein [Flavobacterium branchiophilum]|uniref:Sterol desaturase n=1 Tax=Flavobacterium branchiophilum TaxID=55197 RepID=A0A2H3KX56_9FLAO|nr:sterol desaturase family protein [Flavobacterium branchiophilum]PDS25485.1 sterol desaturase [Flavobacterium branchiophilum]
MSSFLNQETLYAVSIPFFVGVILFEMFISHKSNARLYTFKDTATNVYFGILNIILDLIFKSFSFMVLGFFFSHQLFHLEQNGMYWVACFILQDFMYYIQHYVDHKSRFFWAIHATHHNSEYFNVSTGFRSSVFQPIYRYLFFIPMALLGFSPLHIMFAYSANQIWGTLIHTQKIKKMGFLEYFMVTPSHHRVHHASNEKYIDKNMGMTLIIWDKIFGTFQAEDENYEPIRFGLTYKIDDKGPINIVFHEWIAIYKDIIQPNISWKTRLKYLFYNPGWKP